MDARVLTVWLVMWQLCAMYPQCSTTTTSRTMGRDLNPDFDEDNPEVDDNLVQTTSPGSPAGDSSTLPGGLEASSGASRGHRRRRCCRHGRQGSSDHGHMLTPDDNLDTRAHHGGRGMRHRHGQRMGHRNRHMMGYRNGHMMGYHNGHMIGEDDRHMVNNRRWGMQYDGPRSDTMADRARETGQVRWMGQVDQNMMDDGHLGSVRQPHVMDSDRGWSDGY